MSELFSVLFVMAVAFIFVVRLRQMTFSEGLDWLLKIIAEGVKRLRPTISKVRLLADVILQWIRARKALLAIFSSFILALTGFAVFQQNLLSNSKPDAFLAQFARELDSGNPKVLQNELYFADAKSSVHLLPEAIEDAFEPLAISNSIDALPLNPEGKFSFRVKNRGPYTLESFDVYEFPLFVRHWKIVDLNSAVLTWSNSGTDPQQTVKLGSTTLTVEKIVQANASLRLFKVSPFGVMKYSVSGYGLNEEIVDRKVTLTSGNNTLTLSGNPISLPEDTLNAAIASARGVITKCMNLQAANKSNCEILFWNPNDDRNQSGFVYGDIKNESIVSINWKITACEPGLFTAENSTLGSVTVSCEGFRAVKTKYEENDCYDKKVFGIYVYGCWGLKSSYGTSSEWFSSSLQVPVTYAIKTGKLVLGTPQ